MAGMKQLNDGYLNPTIKELEHKLKQGFKELDIIIFMLAYVYIKLKRR